MSDPIRQAAARRKMVYFGALVFLFTLSIFWRGRYDLPFANKIGALRDLNNLSVLKQAEALDLRESQQGSPEVQASVMRLSLIGSRGFIIAGLWHSAIEKQKRNEFHQLEAIVRTVTQLQPNFMTPWIFQGWNLTYNVSVETDKLSDMYFYISRGIDLLSEGDRVNTKIYHDPSGTDYRVGPIDLRFQIGQFYMNKFQNADKVSTLRCLMNLSSIPPSERKARRTKGGEIEVLPLHVAGKGLDTAKFRQFCEKNPQLVRRLRTRLNYSRPQEIAQFLADNERIPSLFKNDTEKADPALRFPLLPPADSGCKDCEYTADSPFTDRFDAFDASREWLLYAMSVTPPPARDPETNEPMPPETMKLRGDDLYRYRVPRMPAFVIFITWPSRAQAYLAERLTKEGWFDDSSGWNPNDDSGQPWFGAGDTAGQDVILRTPSTSRAAWEKAFTMYQQLGTEYALRISPERINRLEKESNNADVRYTPPDLSDADIQAMGHTRKSWNALTARFHYMTNRNLTKYDHFVAWCEAEKDPRTIHARKLFWEAARANEAGRHQLAIDKYIEGSAAWRDAMLKFPEYYRRDSTFDQAEEATCEAEVTLVNLLTEDPVLIARRDLLFDFGGMALAATTPTDRYAVLQYIAQEEVSSRIAATMITKHFKNQPGDERSAARRAVRSMEDVVARDVPALILGAPAPNEPYPDVLAKTRATWNLWRGGEKTQAAALCGAPAIVGAADSSVAKYAELYRNIAAQKIVRSGEFSWLQRYRHEPRPQAVIGGDDSEALWITPLVQQKVLKKRGQLRK